MQKIHSLIFLSLVLLSCTNEENPVVPPSEQFTIFVEKDYKADNQTIYAVLHNEDGSVLDYKEVFNEDTLKFSLSESSEYHLTICSSEPYNGTNTSTLSSLMNITANGNITLGLPRVTTLSNVEPGEDFEVTVTHPGTVKNITISNAIGSKSYGSTVAPNYANARMQSNKDLDEHLVSVMDLNGRSYYKFFFIEEGKNSYNFDFEELNTYDHEVQISNQDLNFSILQVQEMVFRGNDLKRAFSRRISILSSFGIEAENYTLGYLEGFPIYETSVIARPKNNLNLTLSVSARSSAVPVLDLATPHSFQIPSKNMSDFSMSLPASFERWNARWLYQKDNGITLAWTVFGNGNHLPEFKIPEEIIAENPQLQNIGELYLSSVTATKGKFTYEEWLKNEFVERKDPLDYQEVSWTESY